MKKIKNILLFSTVLLLFTTCSENQIDGIKVGSINGKVVGDGTNLPLENVKISTNPSSSTTFSDSEGNFVLNNVEAQTYSVQAELSGYVTAFESATVIEDVAATVAFELVTNNANNQSPAIPNLVYPEDLATEVPLNIEFAWEGSDPDSNDILSYTLELRNGNTNNIEMFETQQDTFYVATNLELSTTYFWQVKVSDGVNDEVVSALSQFTTVTLPDNPLLLVKVENSNNVIYSGKESFDDGTGIMVDVDLLKLTNESHNSFRPRANAALNKIAYLRTLGGNTHLYTMNSDGSNKTQITNSIPVNGFRLEHIDFCWAQNGSKLYYPNFDKLYAINSNGSGVSQIYETSDGSFISEIKEAFYDEDLLLIKTNTSNGYNARIFTFRLSTQTEEIVVAENFNGALGGIDINANASQILYTRDMSGSENNDYRQFETRIFIFDVATLTSTPMPSDVLLGENDLDVQYSPDEGSVIFTRTLSNTTAVPKILTYQFGANTEERLHFNAARMPDWD